MKIVVIGGSGLIESLLVTALRSLGHYSDVVSAQNGVDIFKGLGFIEVLTGADRVIDISDPSLMEDQDMLNFFEVSGKNIFKAERSVGTKHHITLSTVGVDRLQESGYFRAKLEQEYQVRHSGIPYTIVRSTQFFEHLGSLANDLTVGDAVRVSPVRIQPVAVVDMIKTLVSVAIGKPINGIMEIAGPDVIGLSDLLNKYLTLNNDPRKVTEDENAGYYNAILKGDMLLPSASPSIGGINFGEWYINPTLNINSEISASLGLQAIRQSEDEI